jgi:CBS-domain-containing membrane protein
MTRNPECATERDSIRKAAQMMVDRDCGAIPVVSEDRKAVGIITDRDIVVRVIAQGRELESATVRDAMSNDLKCVRENDSIDKVRQVMGSSQVRRVPVLDDNEKIAGIIALADLATDLKSRDDQEVKLADTVHEISERREGHR